MNADADLRSHGPAWASDQTALSLCSASGDDAATFLQGQLTQSVTGQPQGQVMLGGYCNPKGRLLATLWFWTGQDGVVYLVLPTSLAADTLARLSRFVMRSRCKLADTGTKLWAMGGEAATDWLAAQAGATPEPGKAVGQGELQVIGLPGLAGAPLWLVAAPALPEPPRTFVRDHQALALALVGAGIPQIQAQSRETWVPEEVNLDLLDGVSFTKGCYPGQEVVARSHYRGKQKRRMYQLACEQGCEPPQPRTEIWRAGDGERDPAGQVVNAAQGPDGRALLLADLPADVVGADLRLASASGPRLEVLAGPQGAALEPAP